jgi:hypothetical protein
MLEVENRTLRAELREQQASTALQLNQRLASLETRVLNAVTLAQAETAVLRQRCTELEADVARWRSR